MKTVTTKTKFLTILFLWALVSKWLISAVMVGLLGFSFGLGMVFFMEIPVLFTAVVLSTILAVYMTTRKYYLPGAPIVLSLWFLGIHLVISIVGSGSLRLFSQLTGYGNLTLFPRAEEVLLLLASVAVYGVTAYLALLYFSARSAAASVMLK